MGDYKLRGESNLRFMVRTSEYKINAIISSSTSGREYRVLTMLNGPGGVYGLLEMTDSAKRHTCLVALAIQMQTKNGYTAYKALTELDGPNMASMPEKLLEKLTPLDALYFSPDEVRRSTEWRAKCQKAIDNRKALLPGVKFMVHEPVNFGSHGRYSEFQVEDPAGRLFICNPGMPNEFRAKLRPHMVATMEFTIHP